MRERLSTPTVVLAISLTLTAGATAVVAVTSASRAHARFASAVDATEESIRSRLATYVAMLHGASGLFAASDTVTRREFRAYVTQLELPQRYPGIQGIGYAEWVSPRGRKALVAAMRSDGSPDFRIWPPFARAQYTAILYLEPLDQRNQAALGYDMFTEPIRRDAMQRARDTGLPALSGRVTLVQEIVGNRQSGFLIYLPVYAGDGTPSTVDERRRLLRGFVYSPFRADDLFRSIFAAANEPPVALSVYDGAEPRPDALLHASDSSAVVRASQGNPAGAVPTHAASARLTVAGHTWTLFFDPVSGGTPGWFLPAAVALVGFVMSCTLFAAARAEARARRGAQRSDAVRSRFFAAMSHELRTPLNAIIGYNALLLGEIYGPLTDAQRTGLNRSQRAAHHLTELVNDVLDLSKIEAGKLQLDLEIVDLSALVEELSATIEPMAEARGCPLHRECAPGTPSVRTDPRRVRQIILNLLSNATKFGNGRPVSVRCGPRNDGVMVEVSDQGQGIAPEQMERIFEEFAQLPDTAHGGTGLGLAISRRLAQLLGGTLEAESAVGQGSVFRLVLPCTPPSSG
jgi:signal transduction histidine kinase